MRWELIRFLGILLLIALVLLGQNLLANKVKIMAKNQEMIIEVCNSQNRMLKAHQEIITKGVIAEMDYNVVFVD